MKRMLVCGMMMLFGACGPGVDAGSDDGNNPPVQPSKDTTAPTVASVDPADGATQVDAQKAIRVTFSEPMDVAASGPAFTIEDSAGLELTRHWLESNRVLEVTAAFNPGQQVHWRIGTGARDVAGNALKAAVTGGFTVAGVADTTAPTVLSLSPASAATGVPAIQPLRVTFSEPMDHATAEAAFHVSQPAGAQGTLTWEGDVLVFTPSTRWPWSSQVVWGVSAGAKDTSDNALAQEASGSFTVMDQDLTRPTVAGPTPGASGQPRRFQLVLTFSEPMDRASTEAALTVTENTGSTPKTLSGTATWAQGDRQLTFEPSSDATYGAFISWSLTATAKDPAGNSLVPASASNVFRIIRLEQRVLSSEFSDGDISLNYTSGHRLVITDGRAVDVGGTGPSFSDGGILMARGFLSFDLSPIDPNAARIVSAELAVHLDYVTDNNPFTKWGALTWQAVDYGTNLLGGAAYDMAGGATGVLATTNATGWKQVDVTSLADSRWKNRTTEGTRTQFRFAFGGQAENGSPCYASLGARESQGFGPSLTVQYELP